MSNEHNPIAQRISLLQQKWIETLPEVPDAKIIRWKIKEEESKLFDGFCKLESTPHGALQEVVVIMFTPYEGGDEYSTAIIKDWLHQYDLEKEKLDGFGWDATLFRQTHQDPDTLLMQMLASFQSSMPFADKDLIVGLIPLLVNGEQKMDSWFHKILEIGIPDKVKFMILDYQESPRFEAFVKKHPLLTHTLSVNLDLGGAIDKLVRQGDPNAPDVQFRICMMEMSKAVNKSNEPLLQKWGKQLLEISQKSGIRSMFASAHLVYAGMLFHFEQDEKIQELLNQCLRITNKGLQSEDPAFIPIFIQSCGFIAANHHVFNREKEAIPWYLKQAEFCLSHELILQAIPAFYQVIELLKKERNQDYELHLQTAINAGINLTEAELQVSNYIYLAHEYCMLATQKESWQTTAGILNEKLGNIFGDQWQNEVQKRKEEYAKKVPQLQIS